MSTSADRQPTAEQSNVYEPGQASEFNAHVALFHPDTVVIEDEHDARRLQAAQRRLLARRPDLRHLVASHVPQAIPRPDRGHRRAPGARPVHRRGSRRSGAGARAGPDDPDDESDSARLSPLLLGGAGR